MTRGCALLLLAAPLFANGYDAIVRREPDFWGAVLVARDGKTVFAKGYGMADYDKKPIAVDSLFEIASISKPFTAAAVLKLQMQGKLDIRDPIAKHMPGVPDDKKAITIRHLLTHTSGLSQNAVVPYASKLTRAQFVRHALSFPLESKPGAAFAYNNGGYALLAALVEIVSGESFETFSRKQLFEPAGMKDTGFLNEPQLDVARMTVRRSRRGGRALAGRWFWGWGYRGMGGVVTTVGDMARWDRALSGDAVLDAKTKKDYYEPNLAEYACGWRVTLTARGTRRLGHSGSVAGYAANYARFPDENAVIVVLSNGASDIHALTARLEDELLPPPEIRVDIDVSGQELSRHRAVTFDGTASWEVSRQGDVTRLVLLDPKKRPVLTIHLPAGPAKRLRQELAMRLRERKPGVATKKGMEAGIYLGGHRGGGTKFSLEENFSVSVRPDYRSQGRNGEEVVDARPTLIVYHRARPFWPLMARMDEPTARALLAKLE